MKWWRVVCGIYLIVHFAMLLPWGAELFSSRGVLPDGTASPLLHAFPNVLTLADGPGVVLALLVIALLASVLFAAGVYDRAAAVVVWYVLACLFGRNPLIANPSLPFVGWMLLAHAFVRDERTSRIAAWIVMAAGYSYSGWTKLISPSWADGTALARVLENPLARPIFVRDLVLSMPDLMLQLATWGTLALELLYAPLALSRRARPVIWTLMLAMHLGLMVVIDFAELSFSMVLLHLFAGWNCAAPTAAGVSVGRALPESP